MKKPKLRSPEELAENESAIIWLGQKEISPRNIRFMKWRNVDLQRKTISFIIGTDKKGNCKCRKIKYANSPLEPIINRGQEGKSWYVLSRQHITYKKCGLQPVGYLYEEETIARIIRQNAKKPLTLPLMFGRIKVSKANVTS